MGKSERGSPPEGRDIIGGMIWMSVAFVISIFFFATAVVDEVEVPFEIVLKKSQETIREVIVSQTEFVL